MPESWLTVIDARTVSVNRTWLRLGNFAKRFQTIELHVTENPKVFPSLLILQY